MSVSQIYHARDISQNDEDWTHIAYACPGCGRHREWIATLTREELSGAFRSVTCECGHEAEVVDLLAESGR